MDVDCCLTIPFLLQVNFILQHNRCDKEATEIDDINTNIEKLDTRGPVSKYVLPDEQLRGRYVFFFFFQWEDNDSIP
ncbi:hypothetical protein F0562_008011 [Nyssa sinensis]|uniref:Uncharacterized protein n=1 Tax=Nyssa sinensis TaxID=561372 RepID=A0A5J5A6J7_9ASTE|nr:hypothetical protein F0562_008011 [Nyssa sinensis]